MRREGEHTVLLIEEDTSLRRLITLGLRHCGLETLEAASPGAVSSALLETRPPDLLVLDLASELPTTSELLRAVELHPQLAALPRIVLSWEESGGADTQHVPADERSIYLAKPFDARTLQATVIEALQAKYEAVAAARQTAFLEERAAPASPSIWPLITAAALLLTVIGLMVQPLLAGLGGVIVLVALLLWTLGTKPEQNERPAKREQIYSTSA